MWLLLSNRKNKRVTHVWHFQIISKKISKIFFFQFGASVMWSTRGDMIFLLFYFPLVSRKGFVFFMTEIVRSIAKHLKFIAYVNIISHELCGCVVMFMPSVMKRWYLILIRIFLLLNRFSLYSEVIQSRTYWIYNLRMIIISTHIFCLVGKTKYVKINEIKNL